MAVITATTLNALLDECNGYYLEILGTTGSGYGFGPRGATWGASEKALQVQSTVSGAGDLALQAKLATPAVNLGNVTDAASQAGMILAPLLWAIQFNIIAAQVNATVINLNTYLTYLNTGNPASYWSALQHPAWVQLFPGWFTGQTPSPWNVYADDPGTGNGAAYTGFLSKLIVGTGLTAGDTIDSTKYAGGLPAVTVSGLVGSGVVTVTGTARDPANYSTTSATWTWTATVTANGTTALVPGGGNPAPASSLILAASSITVASGITGGTIEAVSLRPTGRPVEP